MKKVRITVMRVAHYADLIERYENPIEHACDMQEGQSFIANGWRKPDGFCDSAWETLSPFRNGLGPWQRRFLRWLDEEQTVRHALLQ